MSIAKAMPYESTTPIASVDGSHLEQSAGKHDQFTDNSTFSQPPAKPLTKNYTHRFSAEGLALTPTPLKDSVKTLDFSKMIPLGNGRPAAEMLPWQELHMRTIQPETAPMSCAKGDSPFDLAEALDYGLSAGQPKLIDFFTEHIRSVHNPPYSDWQTCLSCGSTSAIERALRIFCNRGDSILAEENTYPGVITATDTLGIKTVGVRIDADGLDPADLDARLSSWDGSTSKKKPFLLYTVPSGQNPTGVTQSVERKKAIYQVAEKHDLYILEDDPYYLLRLDGIGSDERRVTIDEFRTSLPASYLSLDRSGRVLRLDSASKILAPGLRLGWVTGCAQVIEKFVEQAEMSTLAPSGACQAMAYKLMCETWGHDGFMSWLLDLSHQYRQRRDIMVKACDEHLPLGICEWSIPATGMFLWIRIKTAQQENHPALKEIEERACANLEDRGVMVGRGSWFWVGDGRVKELCFRLTFAAAPRERLEEAIRIFGEVMRLEFGHGR